MPAAARAAATRSAKRSASTDSGSTSSRYPGGRVRSTSPRPAAVRTRRSLDTRTCNALPGFAGSCSPHSASIRAGTGTTRSAARASNASNSRSPAAGRGRACPSTRTSTGPRTRICMDRPPGTMSSRQVRRFSAVLQRRHNELVHRPPDRGGQRSDSARTAPSGTVGTDRPAQGGAVIVIRVPGMRSRRDVRAVSARISDVPGVRTLQADLATQTVQVSGSAAPAALTAALTAAGYAADSIDGTPYPSPTRMGGSPVDTTFFSTDITDLPEATRPEVLELGDGDELQLRPGPVAKRLGDSTVRMLGYNGSIPGPTLKVRQGSEVVVHVRNDTDLDTTVHWHGLRLENRFDGVPHETQAPIPPGGEFTYRIQFPDAGFYWYPPHMREDFAQEMGLYGTIVVEPTDPAYWPRVDRELTLTLDDLLVEDGHVAAFSRSGPTFTAMGRFGNILLINGQTTFAGTATAGEVLRLYLVNTANTRLFNVALRGARMKLVGGDSGRYERETFIDEVLLAPSERAVLDVLFDAPGEVRLQHRTPDRAYDLGAFVVAPAGNGGGAAAGSFATLRTDPELTEEHRRIGP